MHSSAQNKLQEMKTSSVRLVNFDNCRNSFTRVRRYCAYFVMLCFFTTMAFAGGDSTKTKFPLDDPRNPDCPCHKYQKLADDEYKKLLAKERRLGSTGQQGTTANGNSSADAKERSAVESSKRHFFKRIFACKHKRRGGHHGRQRKQRKVGDCWHGH